MLNSRQPTHPKIYLGASAAVSKVATLRERGAEVVTFGHDVVEAEMEARRVAEQDGLTYISPYNDLQVINILPIHHLCEVFSNFHIGEICYSKTGGKLSQDIDETTFLYLITRN